MLRALSTSILCTSAVVHLYSPYRLKRTDYKHTKLNHRSLPTATVYSRLDICLYRYQYTQYRPYNCGDISTEIGKINYRYGRVYPLIYAATLISGVILWCFYGADFVCIQDTVKGILYLFGTRLTHNYRTCILPQAEFRGLINLDLLEYGWRQAILQVTSRLTLYLVTTSKRHPIRLQRFNFQVYAHCAMTQQSLHLLILHK